MSRSRQDLPCSTLMRSTFDSTATIRGRREEKGNGSCVFSTVYLYPLAVRDNALNACTARMPTLDPNDNLSAMTVDLPKDKCLVLPTHHRWLLLLAARTVPLTRSIPAPTYHRTWVRVSHGRCAGVKGVGVVSSIIAVTIRAVRERCDCHRSSFSFKSKKKTAD